MKGLKINDYWLKEILSKYKTMEVRSYRIRDVLGRRIALGNTKTQMIEAYATVKEIVKFPRIDTAKYDKEHRATESILERYAEKEFLYGYRLRNVQEAQEKIPYPKHRSSIFTIAETNVIG